MLAVGDARIVKPNPTFSEKLTENQDEGEPKTSTMARI